MHHPCICKSDWTEMLTVFLPLRAKTLWNPLRINIERCRREEGHNSYTLEYLLDEFSAKTTKILSTRNWSILMLSSSDNVFLESVCSFTKYVSSCPNTKYVYLRLRLLKMKASWIKLVSLFLITGEMWWYKALKNHNTWCMLHGWKLEILRCSNNS